MLDLFVFGVMLLQAAAALPQQPASVDAKAPARSGSLELETRISFIEDREVPSLCGPRAVRGCSHFVVTRVTAECSVGLAPEWKITPAAHVIAWVFLRRPGHGDYTAEGVFGHEALHLDDINDSLQSSLDAIAQKSFSGADSCRSAAEREALAFRDKVRQAAGASAVRRDWNRARAKKPPAQ